MHCAERNVGRLVFCIQAHIVPVGNLSRTANDDPVFSAVVVHLKGKLRAGIDRDALYLKTRPRGKRFITPPRAINKGVELVFRPSCFLEACDDVFYTLHGSTWGYQNGILCLYNGEIMNIDCGNEPMGTVQIAVVCVFLHNIACTDIPIIVFSPNLIERFP